MIISKKISASSDGFGVIKFIVIVAIVGIIIAGYLFLAGLNEINKAKAFTEGFHETMRDGTPSDAYNLYCSEFQEINSRSKFSSIRSTYNQRTDETFSFPEDSALDVSSQMSETMKVTSGSYLSTAFVYRSGKVDVGVVVLNRNNTYCVRTLYLQYL